MSALVRYDAMCRAIDAAYEVDEVKSIRDKAMALEHYAQQAMNVDAERRACEIRLRAERKAGRLLRDMEKAKAGRPSKNRSNDTTNFDKPKTLEELGISRDQSSKWQKLAGVPEEEFEAALAGPGKPSTSGIISDRPRQEPMDPQALWVWGRLRDFERVGLLEKDPQAFLPEMTEPMQADVRRLVRPVTDWLKGVIDERR